MKDGKKSKSILKGATFFLATFAFVGLFAIGTRFIKPKNYDTYNQQMVAMAAEQASISYMSQLGEPLNNDGWETSPAPDTHVYGSELSTYLLSPTRTGYVFQGWYETPDCSGEPIDTLDETYQGPNPAEDPCPPNLYFYAKWSQDLSVTKEAPTNGSFTLATGTYHAGDLITISMITPMPGYAVSEIGYKYGESFTSTEVLTNNCVGAETYSFNCPNVGDIQVYVLFDVPYTLTDTTAVDAHGHISMPGAGFFGKKVDVVVTPDADYVIDHVYYTEEGEPEQEIIDPVGNTYSFTMSNKATSVRATFKVATQAKIDASLWMDYKGTNKTALLSVTKVVFEPENFDVDRTGATSIGAGVWAKIYNDNDTQTLKIFSVTGGDVYLPANSGYFFVYIDENDEDMVFSNVTEMDLTCINTSEVTDMTGLFAGLTSLEEIDLSNIDTENVTTMEGMFAVCTALETLNLSSFNTSNVTSMNSMFGMCSSLESITWGNHFDTSNVIYMDDMFAYTPSLATLDLSGFDLSSVLAEIHKSHNEVYGARIGGLQATASTIIMPKALPATNYTDQDTGISWTNYFHINVLSDAIDYVPSLEPNSPVVPDSYDALYYGLVSDNYATQGDLFRNFPISTPGNPVTIKRTTVIIKSDSPNGSVDSSYVLYTPGVSTASANGNVLTIVDGVDRNVTATPNEGYKAVWDLTKYKTEGIVTLDFEECAELDLASWNSFKNHVDHKADYLAITNIVTATNGEVLSGDFDVGNGVVYARINGTTLTIFSINNSKIILPTDCSYFFAVEDSGAPDGYTCPPLLASINLSNFDTSHVQNFTGFFAYMPGVTSLDLSTFSTASATNMQKFFFNSNLTTVDLSTFDMSGVTQIAYMFEGCGSLTKIYMPNALPAPANVNYEIPLPGSSMSWALQSNYSVTGTDMLTFSSYLSTPGSKQSIVKEQTVTISVNDNTLGSVSTGSVTYYEGQTISANGNVLTVGSTEVTATPETNIEGHTVTVAWDLSSVAATNIVYANFTSTINQYKIIYVLDNGQPNVEQTYDYGAATGSAPEDPTKTGYTFNGWSDTAPTTMPAENVTITAMWAAESYTLTIRTNVNDWTSSFGQGYGTALDYTTNWYTYDGGNEQYLNYRDIPGYTFVRYALGSADGETTTLPATMPEGGATIYAIYTANQYHVTLDANGGTVTPTGTNIDYGANYALPTPTREGYRFLGWYLEGIGYVAQEGTYPIPDDITLVAQWAQIHNITAVASPESYGSLVVDKANAVAGENVTVTSVTPSQTYYQLTRLVYMIGSDTTYHDITVGVPFEMPEGDIAIWAIFGDIYYNVYVNAAEHGSITPGTSSASYNSYVTINFHPDEGYRATSLYYVTASDPTTPVYVEFSEGAASAMYQVIQDAVTFTATFAPIHQITASAATHGSISVNKVDATAGVTVTVTITPDTGYELSTLTYTPASDPLTPVNIAFNDGDHQATFIMPEDAVTVNATFTGISYLIMFNTNGGSAYLDETHYVYGQPFTLPSPGTKQGYEFVGWYWTYGSDEFLLDDSDVYTVPYNVTLKAHWVELHNVTVPDEVANGEVQANFEEASEGTMVTVSVTPAANYYLASLYYTEEGSETQHMIQNNVAFAMPASNITIHAEFAQSQFNITVNNAVAANISVAAQATHGENVVVTVNPPAHYQLSELYYVGAESQVQTAIGQVNDVYTFEMPAEAVEIFATFTQIGYGINVAESQHGYVTPNTFAATYNQEVTVEVHPGEGYSLSTLYYYTTAPEVHTNIPQNTLKFDMPGTAVTIVATFTANQYTITFNANGGTTDTASVNLYYDEEFDELPTATRNGYTFNGWYYQGTYKVTAPDTYQIASDITLVAHWTPVEYALITITGLNHETSTEREYTIEDAFIIDAPAAPTGYHFDGWKLYNTGDLIQDIVIVSGTTGDLIYTAYYSAENYDITYHANDGTMPATYAEDFDYDQSVTLPTPTKEGYAFAGWYTEAGFVNLVNSPIPANTYAHDLDLYAKWTANSYEINYNTNGGTINGAYNTQYTHGSYTSLPTNVTKSGYEFAGWYTEPELTNRIYSIDGTTTGTFPVYAKWTAAIYNIAYYNKGGAQFVGTHGTNHPWEHVYDETTPLVSPTRDGYTFGGWFTDPECATTAITSIAANTYTSNISLYANWIAIPYSITYYDEDEATFSGSHQSGYKTSYTVEDAVEFDTPTKAGYTFLGYFEDADCEGERIYGFEAGQTGDVTVYAKWTEAALIVTFHTNGGELEDYTKEVVYNSAYGELPTPTKTNYDFVGWYTDADLTNAVTATTTYTYTTNSDLYAKWTPTVYTITLDVDGTESTVNFTVESEAFTLENPTKDGYTFAGWVKDETNRGTAYNPLDYEMASYTLTASFEVATYTFSFQTVEELDEFIQANYSDLFASITEYDITSEDIEIPNLNLEEHGYTFLGWTWEGQTEPVKDLVLEQGSFGDRVYTPVFTGKKYTVEFEFGDAELDVESMEVAYNDEFGALPTPVKTAYDFAGWYSDEDLTQPVTATTVYELTEGSKLYAKFEPTTYKIRRTVEGLTFIQSYTIESNKITLTTPNKKGYTFLGWSGTGIPEDALLKIVTIDKGSYGDKAYVAHFELATYKIFTKINGQTNVIEYTMESETFTIPAPDVPGYTFTGWSGTDLPVPAETVTIEQGSVGNRTYVANLQALTYTLTFTVDGKDTTREYTADSEDIIVENPTKEGYIFLGWQEEGSDIAIKNLVIESGSSGDRHYTATWKKVSSINKASIAMFSLAGAAVIVGLGLGIYALVRKKKKF